MLIDYDYPVLVCPVASPLDTKFFEYDDTKYFYIFPEVIDRLYVHNNEVPSTTPWYTQTLVPEDYYPEDIVSLVGSSDVYLLYCQRDKDNNFPVSPYALYYFSGGSYYRLNYFTDTLPDFDYSNLVEGEGVYWLSSLGRVLLRTSNKFADILQLRIGNVSLLSLFLSTGFFLYAGWVIAKWIIP